MGQKDNILNCRLIKRDGKLVPINSGMSALYEAFVESLEEAVNLAKKIAESEDIITLSPACASFDMFPNFAVRGNKFKEIVKSLI